MGVDRTYRIRVDIGADTSGAQQAAGALNEATGATNKGTAANAASDKSFVELAEHSRGFHRLLHGIAEMSPAAGLALMAAFSGPQAAIMGLIMLVRSLRQGEEEAAKAAIEFAKEAGKGWGDIDGIINGVIDGIHKSDQAHAEWSKHLGEDSKVITTSLDAQIGKLKAESAAVKEVITAMHQASLARLEADKEAGRVTPGEYAARKAKIEAGKRMGEGGVDATAGKAELAMVQSARDKAQQEAETAKAAEQKAFAASEDARRKTDAGALKTKAEFDKAEAEKLKEKMLGASGTRAEAAGPGFGPALWDKMLNVIGAVGSLGLNPAMGEQSRNQKISVAQTEEDKATKAYRERKGLADKESDAAARAEAEQNRLSLEAAEAKKKAEAAVTQANELKLKAESMAASSKAATAGREAAEPSKRYAEHLQMPFGQATAEMMTRAENTARKLAQSLEEYRARHPEANLSQARGAVVRERGEPSRDDQQQMIDMATHLTGSTQRLTIGQAAARMKRAADVIAVHVEDSNKMVDIMENIARSFSKLSSAQNGRMDSLAARVRALEANPTTRTMPGN